MKKILDMDSREAREFFMKTQSYCSVDLPSYFNFSGIIKESEAILDSIDSSKLQSGRPGICLNLNHRFLANKNGEYSWRPLEIINPILYIKLVRLITDDRHWKQILERFKEMQWNTKILCLSMPFEKPLATNRSLKESIILNWWEEFEQQSIALSLEYSSMAVTDISDCYGSIYTHTLAWALHGREEAKKNRTSKCLLGNKIDNLLQDMHNRQTNGIPQGSVLSDFLAEMVLSYADLLLSKQLGSNHITDYQILRYRDDYRIFTKTKEEGQRILLLLAQVLGELNFKLNSSKTFTSDDIISSSVKPDKVAWIRSVRDATSLQKRLIIIREHARQYPNSGSVMTAMSEYRKLIDKRTNITNHSDSLVAILTDLMLKNPKIYATAASIISKILSFESREDAISYFKKIKNKLDKIPNIGMLELWLQRVSWKYDTKIEYNEALCNLLNGNKKNSDIWNFEWLNDEAQRRLDSISVIEESKLEKMSNVIDLKETELFIHDYW